MFLVLITPNLHLLSPPALFDRFCRLLTPLSPVSSPFIEVLPFSAAAACQLTTSAVIITKP
jgi:hypothetical protein